MPKRTSCAVCGKPRGKFQLVTFIDADGSAHEGQSLCGTCSAGRSFICERRHPCVVFIDATSICPVCAERHANHLCKRDFALLRREWQAITQCIPAEDVAEFLKLVRTAINNDSASPELCLISAVVAAAQRFGTTVSRVEQQLRRETMATKSIVTALLPSRNPAKRYKPKQP